MVAKVETLAVWRPRDISSGSIMLGRGPAVAETLDEVAEWRKRAPKKVLMANGMKPLELICIITSIWPGTCLSVDILFGVGSSDVFSIVNTNQ
jgi:hypothetical protein